MNFERILQVALAFEPAQTLFAGHRLGIFKAVDEKPLNAAELGQRCGLAPRATVGLADALVALGFLRKKDGLYSNAEDVSHFLVPGTGKNYLGGLIDYEIDNVYQVWAQTIPAVREDKPVGGLTAWDYMYGDPEACRQLKPVRHALEELYGDGVARHSGFENVNHVLAVADAGRYMFRILAAYPKLRMTIVDGPANFEYIREQAKRRGFEDRVTFMPCHFVEAEFPKGCDGALISEIIQNWDDETLIRIFRRARNVLPPGAPCAVPEFWINEEKTGPVGSTMHNLQMVLRSEKGYHRSDSEIFRILEQAGFENMKVSPQFGGQGLPMAVYRANVPA
ncbi:MAG TPA: methyltransferase [Archangium sp.]|jgi:hypothetical protein|uniref:methyltransferase n=1 Tax=Archangium sp. TaxID=1872627 RepID=UPI002ED9DD09